MIGYYELGKAISLNVFRPWWLPWGLLLSVVDPHGSTNDSKQKRCNDEVDREIQSVMRGDIEPPKRIVERERHVGEWPACDGRIRRRRQNGPSPESANRLICDNGRLVVPHKGRAKGIPVRQRPG